MRVFSRRVGVPVVCLLCLAALVIAGCGGGESPQRWNGTAAEPVTAAPELAGVNWDGEPFRLADLEGRVAVVSFGYTFCPDVCPFTLAKLKQLAARLGDRAEDLAVVFVSVDPHRDSVEKLAGYVPSFDRRFYGLRLEPDELDTVGEAWNVTVQYGQPKDGPGTDSFYYVDHTGTYFVVDRDGNLRLTYPPDVSVDALLPDIEALLGARG